LLLSASTTVSSAGDVVSAGVSLVLCKTETFPLKAGIEIIKAEIMNIAAAVIVTFERTEAVPRGENAVLETLLVNKAPASVLPGCSKTEPTKTMHEIKNNAYKI
jgi:hypothetical protein